MVSFLVYAVGLTYTLVYCPVDRSKATFPDYQRCASANTLAGVFSGFVSVLVDITLLILPTPIILALEIDKYKKIGLGLTFFSAVLYENYQDPFTNMTDTRVQGSRCFCSSSLLQVAGFVRRWNPFRSCDSMLVSPNYLL